MSDRAFEPGDSCVNCGEATIVYPVQERVGIYPATQPAGWRTKMIVVHAWSGHERCEMPGLDPKWAERRS